MKKALSVLLCLTMLLSLSTAAFASSDATVVQSTLPPDTVIKSGEKYYISTVEDLQTLADIVNSGNTCEGASFRLNNDIVVNDGEFTLSDSGQPLCNGKAVEECTELIVLESIGTNRNYFKGSFIGDGYTISGLYMNALFGKYSQPWITNLNIKNSYVTSNGILGNYFSSSGYIANCSVEGIVNSSYDNVGLFAGTMLGTAVRKCYAEGCVIGSSTVGGLAGNMSGCEVSDSMSNVQVTANSIAGGFAGKIHNDDTVFERCAATGSVHCADGTAGQFASSIEVYVIDDGYDITKTLNICYSAAEAVDGFCYELIGESEGVNQCCYMSDSESQNGFNAYTKEQMQTTDFVDILHADIFAQLKQTPAEWGTFGIYFVGKEGEFPVPYSLHASSSCFSHDFGEWEMYNASNERRYCNYHACDEYETRAHTHTWGDYVYNSDAAEDIDGTKTAHCTKAGCEATDTVLDPEHLRHNAIPLTQDVTLEKGKLYTISTADELAAFAKVCEQDTADVTFVLLNDITVNEGTFTLSENNTPSYNGGELPEIFASAESFSGTFDGMGHTLSGLYLSSALFGSCNGATVKNLNVINSLVSDNVSEYTAAICSTAENTVFENCCVNAFVLGSGKYTGGMVSSAANCTINACRNENTVIGTNAGGLAGYIKDCTVSYCYNQGTVTGDNQAGGLAVCLYDSFVSYCYNSGDVSANTQNGSAGGLACYIDGLSKETYGYTIKNCYTAGEVTGCYTGEFCSSYYGDFLTMLRIYFEGEDVTNADYGGYISIRYEAYREEWFLAQGDGYHTADTAPESLSLIAVNDLKADWCPQYIGGKKFVGDADSSNRGYPQLAMFHEHVWSDYIYGKSGKDIANCLCFNCDVTDEKEHTHFFGEYTLSEDGTTQTAQCICGESSTKNHTHIWGEYTYNNDADCENSGTKTAACTTAGCIATDTVNDTEHPATDHSFGKYVPDEDALSETATCQNEGCNETFTREYQTTASDKYDVSASYSPDCFNEEITLDVAEITADREPGGVYMVDGRSYRQIGIFNIKTVNKNGETVQPNAGYKVTLKIAIPEAYKDRTDMVIYHRFVDGGREQLSTANGTLKIENGYMIFEVSKFSEFEILLPTASMKLTKMPTKTDYRYRSSAVDLTGIELEITKPDGTTESVSDISLLTVSGFNSRIIGTQTVTVHYGELSAEIELTVRYTWWQWLIRTVFFGFLWY